MGSTICTDKRLPMVICSVEVQPCPNCTSYHPGEPYFDELTYTYYSDVCFVTRQDRELVQAGFDFS